MRPSDVYVFAVHAHTVKATLDVLDVLQWDFYVLATRDLDEKRPNQETIGLSSLLKLQPRKATYAELSSVISELVPSTR